MLTGHQSISEHYKLKLVVISIMCFLFAAACSCGIALKVAVSLTLTVSTLALAFVVDSIIGADTVFVLAFSTVMWKYTACMAVGHSTMPPDSLKLADR